MYTDLKTALDELAALAAAEKGGDGPAAFTAVRNVLVHRNARRAAQFASISSKCRREAWRLGQWYLELILLNLFGYTGNYSSRLVREGFRGDEVQRVPWAPTPATTTP